MVASADNDERTPLSHLLLRYETFKVFPRYLNTFTPIEDVTSIEQVRGDTDDESTSSSEDSHSTAGERWEGRVTMPASPTSPFTSKGSRQKTVPSYLEENNSRNPYFVHGKLQELNATIELLLQAAWWSHDGLMQEQDIATSTVVDETSSILRQSKFLSILHCAAHVAESCPTKLTDMIIRLYGFHATNLTLGGYNSCSDNGNSIVLPLHLAITTSQHRNHQVNQSTLACQRKHFIDKMLELDPSAASRPLPGTMNRSPLCHAITSGLQWHWMSPSSSVCICGDKEKEEKEKGFPGPLQSLWNHSPDALHMQDEETGLYPFMMAASVSASTTTTPSLLKTTEESQSIERDEINQLDTIYCLLRSCPQVLVMST